MKKAAVVVLLLAGVAAVAGEAGIMDGFGNFVADVQAEDELPDNEKAQNESEEVTGEEEDSASKIDTSITIGTGSRIAVVSKATDGEYWKLVHRGMEDAVKDIRMQRFRKDAYALYIYGVCSGCQSKMTRKRKKE